MKKSLLYIAAAALGATALGACDNDMALPPIAEPASEWVGMENTDVKEIKEKYWQDANNYNTSVGLTNDDTDAEGNATGSEVIIKGRVISSDATGNIYNNIVILGEDGQALTIAARTASSSKKLNDQYPYGCEVYLNLSGLSVGRYAGLFQVGAASGTEITFLENAVLTEHMQANSIGYPSKVDTMLVDIPTIIEAKKTTEGLQEYMSQLIRVDGVTFENPGQPFAASQNENRYVKDAAGNRLNIRCSSRSTWHNDLIPGGAGSVVGILSYYNNDWQVLMIDEQGCIDFDPSAMPEPTPVVEPEGEGTAASPYNVAKALEVTNALAADATTDTEVYVKGIIVGIDEIDTGSYGNATYSIADVENGNTLKVFRGYWLGGDKFTSADQLAVGKEVTVLGKLVNFKGNTPEMAQGNKVVSYDGQTAGGGDTPTPTPGTPEGDGTLASPYNVAKALEVTRALAADVTTETEVYIKGTISSIKEIDTGSYGNATYSIIDEEGGEAMTVFRGYWFDGAKFTATTQLAVGKEVIVLGKLVNYKGNTPEVAQGNKVVSYDGSTVAPDPTPDPTPDVPVGDAVTIAAGNFPHGDDASATGNVSGALTESGYTLTTDKAGGATAPAVNVYNGVGTLRLYANNTLNIKGATMGKIVFTLNTSTGAKRYTTFAPSTGSVETQATGDATITWNGNTGDVTFTVGALGTYGTENTKPGQIHISSIAIYPAAE